MTRVDTAVLGGGVTGLALGLASGFPVFEARDVAGGICASYYVRPRGDRRLASDPDDGDAYRFEFGGGHWIFGGDPAVLGFINSLTPTRSYRRRSAVYFPDRDLFVPYPIQNHLGHLGKDVAAKAVAEIASASRYPAQTMADWLEQSFGPTLLELFFGPFHELYTAGLWTRIAPQDAYKSPDSLQAAIRGAFDEARPAGYNVTFVYPERGLNELASRMAARGDVRFGKEAVAIDARGRQLDFADGTSIEYDRLISTLPLNRLCEMARIPVDAEPDPHTSVLVLNIGGVKGPRCPEHHWVYIPASRAGFHRVGFYSNVDPGFLPRHSREPADRISIYVEKAFSKAFSGGHAPEPAEMDPIGREVVAELQSWGWLGEAEVLDPTWINVAYTWAWAGSDWKARALRACEEHGIHPVGRYGRWIFQGIADSIRDGFVTGSAFRLGRQG